MFLIILIIGKLDHTIGALQRNARDSICIKGAHSEQCIMHDAKNTEF